jgi:hypothetical protein
MRRAPSNFIQKTIKNLLGDFTYRENRNEKASGIFQGSWELTLSNYKDPHSSKINLQSYFHKEFSAAFHTYTNPKIKISSWQSWNNWGFENDEDMKNFLSKNVDWWKK